MNQPTQAAASLQSRGFFSWRTLRRSLIGLAILVTVVGLLLTFENVRGKRMWNEHKRQLQAQGEKFSIGELAPPPLPDDQNFALTPLLKPALDFTRETGHAVWRDSNALNRLNLLRPDQFSDSAETNRLSLGNLDEGTLADLEACARFYRGNSNYPQATSAVSAAQQILIALGKVDPEIAELEKAAAARPLSRFPIDYNYEPPFAILLPHLQAMRGLCTLLQMRSAAALEAGLTNRAFSELKLGMRLSDSISQEPIVIDHLVRVAMVGINLQTLREGLARRAWSDAHLAALEKELGAIDLLAEYKGAIRGERAFGVGTLDYLRRQRFQLRLSDITGDSTDDMRTMSLMPAGWVYQNMLTISRMHQDFSLAAVDEKAHRVLVNRVAALDQETHQLGQSRLRPYSFIAALLFPSLSKATIKTAKMQTLVDVAQIACALERYRLANGNYPEALEVLEPKFIAKLPHDVINGQPLKYRRTDPPSPGSGATGGSFILYSVGWNESDDGGSVVFSKDGKNINWKEGDWVWAGPTK